MVHGVSDTPSPYHPAVSPRGLPNQNWMGEIQAHKPLRQTRTTDHTHGGTTFASGGALIHGNVGVPPMPDDGVNGGAA